MTVRWRLHRGRKLFQEEWERRERDKESAAGANKGKAADVEPSGTNSEYEANSEADNCQSGAPSTALPEGGAPDAESPEGSHE